MVLGHDNMVTKMGLEGKGKLTMVVLSVLGVVTALVVLEWCWAVMAVAGVVVTTMMVIVLM